MTQCKIRILVLSLVACLMVTGLHVPAKAAAEARSNPTNAFLPAAVPSDYAVLEKYFVALKEGGANTVIIGPQTGAVPDGDTLTNIVYLAHQSGLRIFFILPGRGWTVALMEHPEWEDVRYDLNSGTIVGTGRLDLFNPDAVAYLVKLYRSVASYSIDGILVASDFYYGDTEGMSALVMDEYKKRFSAALVPGKAIVRVGSTRHGPAVLEYGEGFREWTELKKDRLVAALQNIMDASRKVNGDVKFGIPLHETVLGNPEEALSKYAFDMQAFQTLNPAWYWISIPHRDIRESQRLNYKKSMEELARIAQAAATAVQDPSKALIVIQTTTVSGKVLPFSEIEEATAAVRKSGEPGIAYMLRPESTLPIALTKKLFKRQK